MPLVRPFVLLGAVLAGLFLTAGVAVASGPYTPGGGQLVLTPATAAPGDEVTAAATGYGPETEVRILAGDTDAGGGVTDGDGTFGIAFTVPDVDGGPLEIRAIGVDPDGATMVLMAVLTVTGDDPSDEPTDDPSAPATDPSDPTPSASDPAEPTPADESTNGTADPSGDPTGPPGEETPDTGVGLGLGTGLVAAAVAAGGLLTVLAARRRPAG